MRRLEFLMTPGPTEIPLRVLRAMVQPGIAPGDPEFVKVMDETGRLLQRLLETENHVIFFPGSGRVGIEAAMVSVLDPGDKVLTINNGVFGKWLGQTAERVRAEKVELISGPRRAIDPDEVREKLRTVRNIKMVSLVHNETSTGVVNPVAEIGQIVKEYGALYLVDTVSSTGGDFIGTDQWQIDLNCTGCYKCMNCPPGLSIVSVSQQAWTSMSNKKVRASFSFDLYKWLEMWIPREKGGKLIWGYRRHVIEPAPHITYALHEALTMIFEEGTAERYQNNRMAGKALRAAVKAMGLELYPLEESYASNTVTGILSPAGIDHSAVINTVREEFGVVIGGGLEETFGQVIRVAHMGTTAGELYVLHTVRALEKALMQLGWQMDAEAGLNAATRVFNSLEE